jgi:hypothetical protein
MASKKKTQPAEDAEAEIVLEAPAPEGQKALNSFEQYERNIRMVNERVRGLPWPVVARNSGLSERRCKEIFAEWRRTHPPLRLRDPMDIVDDALRHYEALIGDLELDAVTARPGTTVAVGARNAKMRAIREMLELLQAVGSLPADLGSLAAVIDGQIVADRVVSVLERFHGKPVDADFEEAMLEALGGPVKELEAGNEVVDVESEEITD